MAVWEARKQVRSGNQISQVSWTDWVAQDIYYWLEHSFQYASNINCDDELHWIKLSTYAAFTTSYKHCQLTSLWDNGVAALDVKWLAMPVYFDYKSFGSTSSSWDKKPDPNPYFNVTPWVVFQDHFWYCISDNQKVAFKAVNVANIHQWWISTPQDHNEATDEDISTPSTTGIYMSGAATAILNYNNTRLVVAVWWWHGGAEIWVYYPELDTTNHSWATWWKKVLTYEAWVTIVGLTCSFEYLKVWAVDEWWNTKVYYYQGNNDLRNTFVYNLVDLTGVRVLRVYSINGIDYYVTSLDGTDWFVNLYKLVWTTPVKLFKNRAGLSMYDVNYKAPYFVWPTSIGSWYWDGKFYIADAYGLFQFTYDPNGYDKWYMKRWLYNNKQVYGVCENQWYLYVSTEDWCYMMRVLDTGKPPLWEYDEHWEEVRAISDGYQPSGVLISREFEWKEGGTITKMLDEIRMNFELNPLTQQNGTIDVYVSPNNRWTRTNLQDYTYMWVKKYSQLPSGSEWEYYRVSDRNAYYVWDDDNSEWDKVWESFYWWYHAMHITQESAGTRTEKSNLFNDLHGDQSSFKFDRQTITYAIVIKRWGEDEATPIVRQIDVRYHCKDKVNNVYDIN